MSLQSAFRECLDAGDVVRCMAIWRQLYPNMPQPGTADEAEVILHHARTGAESLRLEKRIYSHAWLDERGFRSALPDELRPPAERIRPRIVSAVGVAVGTTSKRADRRAEAKALEAVMARAAGEMVELGILDRERIAARMWQARDDFINRRLRVWQ